MNTKNEKEIFGDIRGLLEKKEFLNLVFRDNYLSHSSETEKHQKIIENTETFGIDDILIDCSNYTMLTRFILKEKTEYKTVFISITPISILPKLSKFQIDVYDFGSLLERAKQDLIQKTAPTEKISFTVIIHSNENINQHSRQRQFVCKSEELTKFIKTQNLETTTDNARNRTIMICNKKSKKINETIDEVKYLRPNDTQTTFATADKNNKGNLKNTEGELIKKIETDNRKFIEILPNFQTHTTQLDY